MSITRVQGNSINSSTAVTSQAVTLPSGVTAGNLVVASVACGSNNTTITGPSGWTQATINQPAGSSATIETSIWWAIVGAGGVTAGQTSWTWTFSAAHTVYICIEEWSSSYGWPSSPVDASANGDTAGTPTQSTTITSGTTSTTAQAEELWIASLAYKGSAQSETSITSGWTKDLEATLSGNNTMTMLYQVVSSVGTASCSYVIGTQQYWAGCVVTFKDNAVALHATLAGVGTLSGTLSAKLTLPSTTLAGHGTLSGTLLSGYLLSATLAGVGTLNGTLSNSVTLSASFNGSSTFQAGYIGIATASSQSIVSLYYQKIQMVQVFDAYGNYLTTWQDAPHISGLKDTVNAAQSQIKLVLPRPIDSYGALGQTNSDGSVVLGNQVKIYIYGPGLPVTGLLKFNGFIDNVEAAVTESQQQSVTVTLTPYSAAFGDHGFGGSQTFSNVDPIALFKYWFDTVDPITRVKYTDPMTWDPSNPTSSGKTVNYKIQNMDLKSIADTTITMLGSGWYWRPNPDNTTTLNQVATTPKHTFQLGKHFASMSYSVDNTQRKNVVYVVGSSQSVKAVSIGLSARPPSKGGIGERLLQVQDSRLTDTTSAQVVADALLAIHDVQQIRAKFRVIDYRGNSSGALGYDIESIRVGDALTILDSRSKTFPAVYGNAVYGSSVWGQSPGAIFNQIIPVAATSYHWSYIDVEAGILAPSQDRRLFQLQRKFQDFTLGV